MFMCAGAGQGGVLIVCCLHVRFLIYEKLANAQVACCNRAMQRGASTENCRIKTLQKNKAQERIFIFVCVVQGGVLIFCSIHVRSLFHEKLANVQVTSVRRQMQRGLSSAKTRIKTLQTKKQTAWVHVHMRMRSAGWRTYCFELSRLLPFLRETGRRPSGLD